MTTATATPARIVVIEDNPADVTLLRYALDHQGDPYELEVLMDGEQAMRFVDEHRRNEREPWPCVIVLDLYLPRYDGLAVLRAIREEPALSNIGVVILSTQATAEEEQQMIELGVRLYRNKPSSLESLIELGAEIFEICRDESTTLVNSSLS